MAEVLKTAAAVAVKTYNGFAKKSLQFFGGLIMEQKDGMWVISLTRVLTWIVFGHCMYVWSRAVEAAPAATEGVVSVATKAMMDVAPNEFYTLCALLGLAGLKIVGSKASDVVSSLKSGGSE